MLNLVTFGCSVTAGFGLNDPDKEAWPAVLSKLMNRNVENKGVSGSSNKEILLTILNHKFDHEDIVVVGWTFINRSFLFEDRGSIKKIGNWVESDTREKYYCLHNDYDLYANTILSIHHADLFLRTKLKNVLHTHFDTDITSDKISVPLVQSLKIKSLYLPPVFIDYAKDDIHPGPKTHEVIANTINKELYDRKN